MVNVSIFKVCVFSFLLHLTGQREKNEIPDLLNKRSPTESFVFLLFFFFPSPPRGGTRRTLPTQRPICPRTIFPFSLYATSWHRADVPDILPNRCPTEFSFLHHLVVHFVSLFSFFFFYIISWHRAEVPDTLLKMVPTNLCFLFLFLLFSETTSWHIFLFFFFYIPRSTEQKFSTHC